MVEGSEGISGERKKNFGTHIDEARKEVNAHINFFHLPENSLIYPEANLIQKIRTGKDSSTPYTSYFFNTDALHLMTLTNPYFNDGYYSEERRMNLGNILKQMGYQVDISQKDIRDKPVGYSESIGRVSTHTVRFSKDTVYWYEMDVGFSSAEEDEYVDLYTSRISHTKGAKKRAQVRLQSKQQEGYALQRIDLKFPPREAITSENPTALETEFQQVSTDVYIALHTEADAPFPWTVLQEK